MVSKGSRWMWVAIILVASCASHPKSSAVNTEKILDLEVGCSRGHSRFVETARAWEVEVRGDSRLIVRIEGRGFDKVDYRPHAEMLVAQLKELVAQSGLLNHNPGKYGVENLHRTARRIWIRTDRRELEFLVGSLDAVKSGDRETFHTALLCLDVWSRVRIAANLPAEALPLSQEQMRDLDQKR